MVPGPCTRYAGLARAHFYSHFKDCLVSNNINSTGYLSELETFKLVKVKLLKFIPRLKLMAGIALSQIDFSRYIHIVNIVIKRLKFLEYTGNQHKAKKWLKERVGCYI